MLAILLPFIAAFLTVLFFIPPLIKLAYHKRLVDDPGIETRKVHRYSVPNLGGVAVFGALALISCLFVPAENLPQMNFLFAAGIIVFCVGLKDDLIALNPYKKFFAQFTAAFIIVYLAEVRYINFYGVLGIYEVGPLLSYIFTSFFIVFVINAFNLIDGINGLLGLIALSSCVTFGILFYYINQPGLSTVSAVLAGALVGFLFFNLRNKARIFMGDAGAYSVGFILAFLSIRFVQLNPFSLNSAHQVDSFSFTQTAPAMILALLFIPTFDTFRVFTLRILAGKSPFNADRKHLHHRLLDLGFNHIQSAVIIAGINLLVIMLTLTVHNQVETAEMMLILSFTMLFSHALLWLYELRQTTTEEVAFPALDNPESTHTILKPTTPEVLTTIHDIRLIDKAHFTQEMLSNLEKSKN